MKLSQKIAFYGLLTLLAAAFVLPLLSMVATSLKTPFEASQSPSLVPEKVTFDAYAPLLTWSGQAPVLRWFVNSVIVSTLTTVIVLCTATLAAYALARFRFPGRRLVFGLVVGTLFVPGFIFLIPNYIIIDQFGLLDTLLALILPAAGGAFGVFFLAQFFSGLPAEFEEAALLDGANQWQIFRSVMLPLAQGGLSTLAVITFLGAWNDFLWPTYVLFGTESLTLTAGLPLLQNANVTNLPLIMAGAVLASVPAIVVFVIAQRKIIQSVASAGLKG
ncbi:carbohydrate ABC transporter permease [Nonomuraea jabiensis]|uniref:carbohydrate ABC transporter permease n=1 Tax=Nonomuraea jabiensis TaxID=882448 RepID=UPI00367D0D5F